jgi:hypothetical protein
MSDGAELVSIAWSVGELERRIAEIAKQYETPPRDELLGPLYDAERMLKNARRRIELAAKAAGAT